MIEKLLKRIFQEYRNFLFTTLRGGSSPVLLKAQSPIQIKGKAIIMLKRTNEGETPEV